MTRSGMVEGAPSVSPATRNCHLPVPGRIEFIRAACNHDSHQNPTSRSISARMRSGEGSAHSINFG